MPYQLSINDTKYFNQMYPRHRFVIRNLALVIEEETPLHDGVVPPKPEVKQIWTRNYLCIQPLKLRSNLMSQWYKGSRIGDVVSFKRHQRLNEILTFLPALVWEISKVVYKKTLLCKMPAKINAILCNQHALVMIASAGFIQHTPDKRFLVNNFADFPDVWVKKSRFCPVGGGVWN